MKRLGQSKRRTMAYRSITLLSLLVMAVAALVPYAVDAENPYSTISPKSGAASDIQSLYKVVFWLALIVFIGVQFGVAYTALKFRRRNENEPRPEQIHGNKTLEIVWTIIPAVILLAIFIPNVRTMYDFDAQANDGEYVVNIYGKQWWWEVHYSEPEEIGGVVTANEIYVPVGKRIQLNLFTNNVIHSFWVPQLSGKMDLIPGHINRLGFTVNEPGMYYGECAEFCGDSHALMRFKVIAVDEATFAQWVENFRAGPSAASGEISGDVAKVPDAFGICIGCHRVEGTNAIAAPQGLNQSAETESGGDGAAKIAGPNLTDFACRTTIGAGAMPNDVEHLREWLHNPGAVKPGTYMGTVIKEGTLDIPTADETDDPARTNLDVIVDYLVTLSPEGGCVPITGVNAEHVVQLATAGEPIA